MKFFEKVNELNMKVIKKQTWFLWLFQHMRNQSRAAPTSTSLLDQRGFSAMRFFLKKLNIFTHFYEIYSIKIGNLNLKNIENSDPCDQKNKKLRVP